MSTVAVIRCPSRGHRLARLERVGAHITVTPEKVTVHTGDDKHRAAIAEGGAASVGVWQLMAPFPVDLDVLRCHCGEFFYPEDLVAQVRANRRVILAQRL